MANRAQRSSVLKGILMYVGICIGAISTLFIYPLQLELYGSLQFLISTASLFVPIATFGILSLTNRYFPFFQDSHSKHHGFFGLLLHLTVGSLIIFAALGIVAKDGIFFLLEKLNLNASLIEDYLAEIFVVMTAIVFLRLATMYLINFKRIVASTIIENLLPKLILPLIILASYYELIRWHEARWLFSISLILFSLILMGYIYWLGEFSLKIDFQFLKRDLSKEMGIFASYGIIRNLGTLITNRVDTIMIATMIDLRNTGIYAIALFISNIIVIPRSAIVPIWTPDIARCSKEGRIAILDYLYKRSAKILYFFCALLFIFIWFNIQDILSFSTKAETLLQGKNVILYIGLAKLVDSLFGLNGAILTFSKYYRFNVVMGILIGLLSIGLNLILIPRTGIDGAALATLIALFVFNLIKFFYVRWRLKIQPFSKNLYIIFALSLATFGILSFIPNSPFIVLNIAYKTIIILLCFVLPVLRFKLVPELPKLLASSVLKVKKRLWPNS